MAAADSAEHRLGNTETLSIKLLLEAEDAGNLRVVQAAIAVFCKTTLEWATAALESKQSDVFKLKDALEADVNDAAAKMAVDDLKELVGERDAAALVTGSATCAVGAADSAAVADEEAAADAAPEFDGSMNMLMSEYVLSLNRTVNTLLYSDEFGLDMLKLGLVAIVVRVAVPPAAAVPDVAAAAEPEFRLFD